MKDEDGGPFGYAQGRLRTNDERRKAEESEDGSRMVGWMVVWQGHGSVLARFFLSTCLRDGVLNPD